ncbi:MAG: hypothetical protein ACLVEX_15175 [Ruthenibacterium lactatiformans]
MTGGYYRGMAARSDGVEMAARPLSLAGIPADRPRHHAGSEGQLSHIESLSFHMQEGLGWGISAPSMVTYFLSEDGVTFHRVGRVSRFDAVKDEDPDHYYSVVENGKEVNCQSYYFTLDGLNYNARYVKVAFELLTSLAAGLCRRAGGAGLLGDLRIP